MPPNPRFIPEMLKWEGNGFMRNINPIMCVLISEGHQDGERTSWSRDWITWGAPGDLS